MILEFKNLGYIKNAKVDLSKDLIIFCGPNNTGKTYVAYAIYGLMKSAISRSRLTDRNLSRSIVSLFEKESFDIVEGFEKINSPLHNNIAKDFLSGLDSIFASTPGFFLNTELTITLKDIEPIKKNLIKTGFESTVDFSDASISLLKKEGSSKLKYVFVNNRSEEGRTLSISPTLLREFAGREVIKFYRSLLFPQSYIAPAERIAINLFSKELSLQRNVLVDRLLELREGKKTEDPFDLVSRRASRYPLPVRDSLEIAEDLNNFKKSTSDFSDFAEEIESGVLRGKVNISREGEVQFKPQKGNVLLPIHLSSSAVKSLSNLVIYFRHLASKNDFIIIDEPELNLHPDNQVIIARIIAKIVNRGFKVLINTHSDYIIRELNNLIMLDKNKEYVKRLEYSKDEILRPQQIEALLFHYKTKKVEKLEVTESGFEVETIDKITSELNSRSQALYFKSFGEEDG